MRVALTVEALSPHLSGIGRYTWELAQRLGQEADVTDLSFYRGGVWVVDPAVFLTDLVVGRKRHRVRLPRWVKKAVDNRRGRDRLFHGPNYFLPEHVAGGIITVHDLSVFRYPETHPLERIRQFEREFESSMQRAHHVITDSATVRDELIAFTGIAADRVTAVPLGVSLAFRPKDQILLQPVLERYGLTTGQYALCVSTLDPRKKIVELLTAWNRLPPSVRLHWPLVVVGGSGWLSDDLQARMDRGAVQGWVKYLGFVPEADLPELYAGATLFVYPSVYEGFGLPPIEAMACAVPVLVSNSSCLPEVTQGAALTSNPDDPVEFANALEKALTDTTWREQAKRDGLGVAATYKWERCVSETVAVYKKTLVDTGRSGQ